MAVTARLDHTEPEPGATATVSPRELVAELRDGKEIALLDVRDESAYAVGHLLLSSSVPADQLEVRVASLVPRRSARLVVIDDDGGPLALDVAERLGRYGYGNVRVLAGGAGAWQAAGLELFTGLNVLSKALGEFVERHYHTPRVTVNELKARQDAGEDLVVLDTRPLPEYTNISIPGAAAAPGAELLYRAYEAVERPETTVVVNCAGRTRAIIGAQALINAGFPNPVLSLENGTSAWLFEGFEPGRGETNQAAVPGPEGLDAARQAAGRVAERFGVQKIGREELAQFATDAERTLFLFDVRTPEEYEAGHLAGSRSAPGGQLVQATDTYVGTFRGRIVLVDGPDAVRATITASWLIQLGLDDVYVLADPLTADPLTADPLTADPLTADPLTADPLTEVVTGPDEVPVAGDPGEVATTAAPGLAARNRGGEVTVLDIAVHPRYYEEHRWIPGSRVARRSTLVADPASIPGTGPIVITSPDGTIARFAAAELAPLTDRDVRALAGGTRAWIESGLPTNEGTDRPALTPDAAIPAHPDLDQKRKAFAAYVAWGDVIVDQIARDGSLTFRAFD